MNALEAMFKYDELTRMASVIKKSKNKLKDQNNISHNDVLIMNEIEQIFLSQAMELQEQMQKTELTKIK